MDAWGPAAIGHRWLQPLGATGYSSPSPTKSSEGKAKSSHPCCLSGLLGLEIKDIKKFAVGHREPGPRFSQILHLSLNLRAQETGNTVFKELRLQLMWKWLIIAQSVTLPGADICILMEAVNAFS